MENRYVHSWPVVEIPDRVGDPEKVCAPVVSWMLVCWVRHIVVKCFVAIWVAIVVVVNSA
jgi:hypothetical protein